jgi:hypothetical protein
VLTVFRGLLRSAVDMDTLIKARLVANYVSANWTLETVPEVVEQPVSENIAAILVDTVFQAGLNYRTVVLPRVRAIASAFPKLTTLDEMDRAMHMPAFSAALSWSHAEKPSRLRHVVGFLRLHSVSTLADLRSWLHVSKNRVALLTVRGIGHKSVDYLCRLLGIPAIAVDRHAQKLLQLAGVAAPKYLEARRVLEFAADLLLINRGVFDRVMWQRMSERAA